MTGKIRPRGEMKALISIVVIIGLAAVAGSIIVGVNSFNGTVTENPYEEGLRWDEMHRRESEPGWTAGIRNVLYRTGGNDMVISVSDNYGNPLEDAAVSVITGRSATSKYDRTFNAAAAGDGLFSAEVTFPVYGYWDVTIVVVQNPDTMRFQKKIFVEKRDADNEKGK